MSRTSLALFQWLLWETGHLELYSVISGMHSHNHNKQRFPSSRKQMYDLHLWHSKIIYMAFYLYGTVGGAGTGNTLTGKETRAMTRDILSWVGIRLMLLQNCLIIKFFQKSERDSSPQNSKNAHLHFIATKTIHAAQGQKRWRQKMSKVISGEWA